MPQSVTPLRSGTRALRRAHITGAAKRLGYGLSADAIKMNLLG
jgi:hypothetical protein